MAEKEEKVKSQTDGNSDDQGEDEDDPGNPFPTPVDEPDPGTSGG